MCVNQLLVGATAPRPLFAKVQTSLSSLDLRPPPLGLSLLSFWPYCEAGNQKSFHADTKCAQRAKTAAFCVAVAVAVAVALALALASAVAVALALALALAAAVAVAAVVTVINMFDPFDSPKAN